MTEWPGDFKRIEARIKALWVSDKITKQGDHHIWHGRWRGQPEAKINGKRQGIMPHIWYSHTGKPVNEDAKIYRTCDNKLCVNPDHYEQRGSSAIIRGSRTKSAHTRKIYNDSITYRRLARASDPETNERVRQKAYELTEGDTECIANLQKEFAE